MSISEILYPQSLEEVKNLLDTYKNSKILAGGTDLVLDLRRGKFETDYLISLSKINELKAIEDKGESISIGTMVTFTELKENPLIKKYFNALINSASSMGAPQIRNVATIGGNIVNAAPAADSIPSIMCFDGVLIIECKGTKRTVSCEEYFRNYENQFIKDNEILVEILLPKTQSNSGFYKLGKRNALAISRLTASVNINIIESKIMSFKLALGAVGKYPFIVKEIEDLVLGKEVNYILQDEVTEVLRSIVYESIKNRKTMPFKKEAVKGVYKEAVLRALMSGGNLNE